LIGAGFQVFAHDAAFPDADPWKNSSSEQAVKRLGGDAATALEATWAEMGRIDALVSNDHYPAIHHPAKRCQFMR